MNMDISGSGSNNKRSIQGEGMEEEEQISPKRSNSSAPSSSNSVSPDKDNNNSSSDEDEEDGVIDMEEFNKDDIVGTLLIFEAVPNLITIESISAIITKLDFKTIGMPTINEFYHNAYVRIVGEDVYDAFKAKYRGDIGRLAPRRMIGTDTIYANLGHVKDALHFDKVKSVIGTQFIEKIIWTLKNRESNYVDVPKFHIEILSMKSAILHFSSPADIFAFHKRILATDFFFVNDITLRIIKNLTKLSNDIYMRLLATFKPVKGSRKFAKARESLMIKITMKIFKSKKYAGINVPLCWSQIFKKSGQETNMAIGVIAKGDAPGFMAAVKDMYTDHPEKVGGFILTVEEERE